MKIAVKHVGPIETLVVIESERPTPHYELSLNKNMLMIGRSGSGKSTLVLILHFLPFILLNNIARSGYITNILDKYFHIYCREGSQIDIILPLSDILSTEHIESITGLAYDHALKKYPYVRVRLRYIGKTVECSSENSWSIDIYLETNKGKLVKKDLPFDTWRDIVINVFRKVSNIITVPYLYLAKVKEYTLTILTNIEKMLTRNEDKYNFLNELRLLILTRLPFMKPIVIRSFENLREILESIYVDHSLTLLKDITDRYSHIEIDKDYFKILIKGDGLIDIDACSTGELVSMLLESALNICESAILKELSISDNHYIVIDDIFYGLTYRDLYHIINSVLTKIGQNYSIKVMFLTHRIELFYSQEAQSILNKVYVMSRGFSKLEHYIYSKYGEILGKLVRNVVIDLEIDNISEIVKDEIWEESSKILEKSRT